MSENSKVCDSAPSYEKLLSNAYLSNFSEGSWGITTRKIILKTPKLKDESNRGIMECQHLQKLCEASHQFLACLHNFLQRHKIKFQ